MISEFEYRFVAAASVGHTRIRDFSMGITGRVTGDDALSAQLEYRLLGDEESERA